MAAFRMGEALTPDLDLVEAWADLDSPENLATISFNEAAVAYRTGDIDAAGALLDRALDVWRRLDRRWPALLGRSLAAAVRGLPHEEAESLAAQARECPITGFGIQALALLRRGCPSLSPFPAEVLIPLCRDIPEAHWDERLDVLSVRESLASCRG
ncbi:MAG: hypothetical protein QM820_54830 [Minicystis sp.]